MKIGALILASKKQETENTGNEELQTYLPMISLDGSTVIKKEIFTLRRAGVSPIIVMCGYQQEVLKNHLSHNGVVFCEEENYDRNSARTTLELGLKFASELCDKVLVIPAECPAFSLETVETLMNCEESTIPVYEQKSGNIRLHVFGENSTEYAFMEVEDEGILLSLLQENGVEKVREYTKNRRDANMLTAKTKVILSKEEDFFGPGVYHLLQYIGETGSIQAAAAKMHMSYTKGWKMINKVEKELGFPFLKRVNGGRNGGSSTITEEGRLFMERYNAMVQDMRRISQSFFDIYFQDFQ